MGLSPNAAIELNGSLPYTSDTSPASHMTPLYLEVIKHYKSGYKTPDAITGRCKTTNQPSRVRLALAHLKEQGHLR